MFTVSLFRSNKSLQKYFAALDQSLQGMELVESYGAKFDRTKHGSLFLSKVTDKIAVELQTNLCEYFTITEKGAFSWLKAPTSAHGLSH